MKVVEYDSKEFQLGSDHRPVYGIYELEIQLPYNPLVPLFMRPKILEGVIKFHEIEIDYYYKMMTIMNENVSFPCEISFSFYAPFLVNNPSSTPVLIEKVNIFLFILRNFYFNQISKIANLNKTKIKGLGL